MFSIPRESGDINLTLPTPKTYFYRFLCVPTGKSYIGRTNNPIRRITQHMEGEGSPALLSALVEYGRLNFTIELLDSSNATESILDLIEDHYITKFDSLHPVGFNMRMNVAIVPNDIYINLADFTVDAKYVFTRNNHLVFSCGEFTQSRAYQTCANVVNQIGGPCPIKKKQTFQFNYYELSCTSLHDVIKVKTTYIQDTTYTIRLKFEVGCNPTSGVITNRISIL
jgi:predicted GIY-YIG superfamily endonuclease